MLLTGGNAHGVRIHEGSAPEIFYRTGYDGLNERLKKAGGVSRSVWTRKIKKESSARMSRAIYLHSFRKSGMIMVFWGGRGTHFVACALPPGPQRCRSREIRPIPTPMNVIAIPTMKNVMESSTLCGAFTPLFSRASTVHISRHSPARKVTG